MTKGCLIFAYDGDVLYGPQAVIAAQLVTKHLRLPVSLVTDSATVSKLSDVSMFEQVFIQEVGNVTNTRVLGDAKVIWKNTNRSSAYDITPYDRTLVIDSDFLVFSDRLAQYINSDADFMICPSMNNNPMLLNPNSIPMLWATNIIFNKTPEVQSLFNLIDYIKDNWTYYGALYKFNTIRFRNDFAFSIASHILGGEGISQFHTNLPSPVMFGDKDTIVKISKQGVTVLTEKNELVKTAGQDIHVLNKYTILDYCDQLRELLHD